MITISLLWKTTMRGKKESGVQHVFTRLINFPENHCVRLVFQMSHEPRGMTV